jgi:hypothetical protein
MDAGEGGLLAGDSGDPVEGGVGEDGVELVPVGQIGGAVMVDDQIALAGCCDHGGGGVDPGDDGSGGGELLGEGPVAAAQVEDVLAGLGREEIDYAGGEVGDETAVGGVGFGVPGLSGGARVGLGCRVFHILIVSWVCWLREQNKYFHGADKR